MFRKRMTGFVLMLGASALLHAQPQAPEVSPAVKLAPPVFRGLTVETVYPLKVAKYLEPTRIELRSRPGSTATPEDTLIEMVSSMVAQDFQWNSRLWTPESLKGMAAHDAARGRTPADWVKTWAKYKSLSFYFATRVEYARYVLIEYEAKAPDGSMAFKESMGFEKVGNSWLLTQALAADPVLLHWDNPSGRVQVAPEALFTK
jgi:hypothetical protein